MPFWRVGFVLMASMLAGLYTEGGVYIKGGYTVRPVYKFSKWGPLHVVWVYEDFRGRGRGCSPNQPISGIIARLTQMDG